MWNCGFYETMAFFKNKFTSLLFFLKYVNLKKSKICNISGDKREKTILKKNNHLKLELIYIL